MVADYTQQSLADPASLALQQRQMELQAAQEAAALQLQQQQLAQQSWYQQAQLGQNAQQFATETQTAQQSDQARLQLQWAQLNQSIMESNQRLGLETQNLQFLRDKMSIDVQAQNAAAQRDTQALIEQITARMERTMTERAGLTQQAQMLQSQMQYQAAVENARNQIEADKTNEARRQFNLEQRRGVANDIANFARDPGDVGANAAYLLAGGQAPISQAMASGADARTPQSLLPLGLLQGTQDELNRGPNLLNAPSVSAPNVPLPEFGATGTPNVAAPTPIQMPAGGVTPPQMQPGVSMPAYPTGTTPASGIPPAPTFAPIAPGMPGAMPPLTPGVPPPPGALPPAAPAPTPLAGQAAPRPAVSQIPTYLSPYGDPWAPATQDRWNTGIANDSIDIVTQQEDINQHQYDLAQAGAQLAAGGDTNVEDWERVAQEYQNRGYDIPGFAQGTPDFLNQRAGNQPGSNAPVSIVGEHRPEVLLNHAEIPGGPDEGFSVAPSVLSFLNALPQQASPMATSMRGRGRGRRRGVPGFDRGTPDWATSDEEMAGAQRGYSREEWEATSPDMSLLADEIVERLFDLGILSQGERDEAQADVIYEDDPRWDPATMGNGMGVIPPTSPAGFDDQMLDFAGVEDRRPRGPQPPIASRLPVPGYAEGTPDWASLMGGANPDATYGRSLGFLNDAFGQALGQSPWVGQGSGPNPVALSSPGTNPFIQEYAAALAATGQGIKPGLFQYEINQWKPQALSGQTVTRRTR